MLTFINKLEKSSLHPAKKMAVRKMNNSMRKIIILVHPKPWLCEM